MLHTYEDGDSITLPEGFVGAILSLQDPYVFSKDKTKRYLPQLSSLSVQPLEGQIQNGPAQVVMAPGQSYYVTVVGTRDMVRPADALEEIFVMVQGLPPGLFPRVGARLEQASSLPAHEPGDSLQEALQQASQRWEIRYAALQVLATLGEDVPVEPLVVALDDDAWRVRWQAAHMLSQLGTRAPLEPFLLGIQDKRTENQGVRNAAPEVLAAHPDDDRVVAALDDLLHDPNDGSVSAAAARELGGLGSRVPTSLVVEALQDSMLGMRLATAWGLAEYAEPLPSEVLGALVEGLHDPDRSVRTAMAEALAAHGGLVASAVRDLVEEMLQQDQRFQDDMESRHREIQAQLERTFDPDTPREWLHAVESSSEIETRVAAVKRLGTLGTETPVSRLLALLEDDSESGGIQMTAAETLATLGGQVPLDATVVDALCHLIANSRDDPQFAASEALKALAPWLPREALVAHLGDGHWEARNSALEALIALGPDVPGDILVSAVGDVSEHIRGTALEALREFHPELFPPLVEEALAILQGKPAGPTLESLVRFFQAETIARREVRSPEAVSHLTELLQWPYWLVRLISVEALTDIGEPWPPTTRDRLEHLAHDPQSAAIRSAAQAALAHRN